MIGVPLISVIVGRAWVIDNAMCLCPSLHLNLVEVT